VENPANAEIKRAPQTGVDTTLNAISSYEGTVNQFKSNQEKQEAAVEDLS